MRKSWDRVWGAVGGESGAQLGEHLDRLPLAPPVRRPDGSGDLDPLDFPHGWDVMAFVSEFGLSGAEVGQTYPWAGVTLGDRGSDWEPITF